VAHRLELRQVHQVADVVLAAGEVVVDAQHVVALADQALAQMRPKESGAARHQDTLSGQAHADGLLAAKRAR
jgi:hypothetical protein